MGEDEPTEEQLKLLAEVHEELCYQCGGLADRFEPDPYESEVNGDDTPRWMCSSCYDRAGDEI